MVWSGRRPVVATLLVGLVLVASAPLWHQAHASAGHSGGPHADTGPNVLPEPADECPICLYQRLLGQSWAQAIGKSPVLLPVAVVPLSAGLPTATWSSANAARAPPAL